MEIVNLSVGSILAARYQIAELLGEGGSGSTYRATRLEDGTSVAIKVLSLRHLNDWKQLELFEREAKVLSQLNHPQIPEYLEYFHVDTPDNRAFYIVQQLAPGKPLTAWVQSGWRSTEIEVRDIASQLLEILQYLHQQSPPLIHRDLKPHNIIRNDDGRIFLVDFGAVQNVYNNTMLKGYTVAGTYGYMAPEQFRGAAVPASDLYGLGATILYLLTHRSPADLPQERLKLSFRTHVNISNHFADWLEMMLEPDTADRFSSADVALNALKKQHQFRIQTGTKIGFPWRGTALTAAILVILAPLIYRYRYALLTSIGITSHEPCELIGENNRKSLDEYLAHGVSINASVGVGEFIEFGKYRIGGTGSLLHCAIQSEQTEIMADLIRKGADIHILNSAGYSPLMVAVQNSNASAVRNLLQAGADPHAVDRKGLSLWHFLNWNNSDREENKVKTQSIPKELIAKKVDINKQDIEGNTPLHLALKNSNDLATYMLLNYKAKTDVSNNRGQTTLMTAVISQNFDMVKLLISQGGGVNIADNYGTTPLMATITGNTGEYSDIFTIEHIVPMFTRGEVKSIDTTLPIPKIINLLIDKGASLNLVNLDGDTALHLLVNLETIAKNDIGCAQNRSLAIYILDLLIKHQADLSIVNKNGDTALHVLAKKDFFPVTDRMIQYGANPLHQNAKGKNAVELASAVGNRQQRCPPRRQRESVR